MDAFAIPSSPARARRRVKRKRTTDCNEASEVVEGEDFRGQHLERFLSGRTRYTSVLGHLPPEMWALVFEWLCADYRGPIALARFAGLGSEALAYAVTVMPILPLAAVNKLPMPLFRLCMEYRPYWRENFHRLLRPLLGRAVSTTNQRLVTDQLSSRKLMSLLEHEAEVVRVALSNQLVNEFLYNWRHLRLEAGRHLFPLVQVAVRHCDDSSTLADVGRFVLGNRGEMHRRFAAVYGGLFGNKHFPTVTSDALFELCFRDGEYAVVELLCRLRMPSDTTLATIFRSSLLGGRFDYCQTLISGLGSAAAVARAKTGLLRIFVDSYALVRDRAADILTAIYNGVQPDYVAYATEYALTVAATMKDVVIIGRIADTMRHLAIVQPNRRRQPKQQLFTDCWVESFLPAVNIIN